MYVPNYIPEPLEVPGNITLRPYKERVRFTRVVTWLFTGSLFVAAAFSKLPQSIFPPLYVLSLLVVLLALLDLVRIFFRGRSTEGRISAALLPIVLGLAGCGAGALERLGAPCWAVLFGGACMALYAWASGRDFSFVGCFFLSLVASSVGIAGFAIWRGMASSLAAQALAVNFIFLCYAVYDLASLLARRRTDEAFAAVTDLYRDVFNFVSYFYRCVHHWRKHQIWIAPKEVNHRTDRASV